jgi:hypothetical protein
MTKNEKIAILEEVLRDLKKDQGMSKRNNQQLLGLCIIFGCLGKLISDFPEVMALKPEKEFSNEVYWFDTDPSNNQRIELIEKVLTELKTK